MKRLIALIFIVFLLTGCRISSDNPFVCSAFEADLPETFRPVSNASVMCFAPYGDPLHSSSITFYATELNWYFDSLTEQEYEDALKDLCGYETFSLSDMRHLKIDGYSAVRVACRVTIDQGEHDLIIYAIQADQAYFFTLLNRDTDSYIEAFDAMMKTIRLKGMQS